jgi:alpha-L-fucosidase
MTMNDTWGFKSDDHHWKSSATLIRNLVDIASKGGNYLLNIGPTAQGEIPPESIKLLKEVGAWMKVNGESIHGTHASPFKKLAWGRCTVKPAGDDTLLYLHVLEWPADGQLMVPGLANEVTTAELLAGGTALAVAKSANGPVLTLPAAAPDASCSTIRMRVKGTPKVLETLVAADKDGVIRLLPGDAHFAGDEIRVQGEGDQANIGYWTRPKDSISWDLRAGHDGKYLLQVEAAAPEEGSVLLIQGIGKLAFPVPKTTGYEAFQTTKVGEVSLPKETKITLTLRPVEDGWHPVNVRKVELIPQP